MDSTALETAFPTGLVSAAAEQEAWRKEVHRPATHTHKWWAQRLGSVFRGMIAAALTDTHPAAEHLYQSLAVRRDVTVLDPFAGSGTTLVEAAKMGCRVIGYDINPVATLVQRQALAHWDPQALSVAFKEVEERARAHIDSLHITRDGEPVLYYFWVGGASCPRCPEESKPVELFSSYVFAQHAYPKRFPAARASCPDCHSVVLVSLATDRGFTCNSCGWSGGFGGPVSGATMTCPAGHRTKIVDALGGMPPQQRMYAKLVLTQNGKRRYDAIDDFDRGLYAAAERLLAENAHKLVLPKGHLEPGHNTRQAMSWGYKAWQQFFNARQLYSLGLLGATIRDLPRSPEREALATLFSAVTEFNNLFCSYKGEGTGAVRHMFSHHILKPERTPLEAHPWGTPASSGAFSTLFRSRLLRAHEYKTAPHDIVRGDRVFGISLPLGASLAQSYNDFTKGTETALVATQSSARVGLPDRSVDLVLTDPPYFDNVHYSELADFFHAWLRGIGPFDGYPADMPSTRSGQEVQSTDAGEFSETLASVWAECARVMKDDALLAFTFHQSRPAGWAAVVKALRSAGLVITAIQPVKGEMSVSTPKAAAADPSNLDSIVVCRKSTNGPRPTLERVVEELRECQSASIAVGWSDVQSVVRGAVLACYTDPACGRPLDELMTEAAMVADCICADFGLRSRKTKR